MKVKPCPSCEITETIEEDINNGHYTFIKCALCGLIIGGYIKKRKTDKKGEMIMPKPPPGMPNLKGMPQQQQPQQMQFSREAIESAEPMVCMNEIPMDKKPGEFMQCGGEIFVEATRLRYINPIMSPTGQQTIATVNIGKLCIACGKIFQPDAWLKQKQEIEKATKGTILDKNGKAADGHG